MKILIRNSPLSLPTACLPVGRDRQAPFSKGGLFDKLTMTFVILSLSKDDKEGKGRFYVYFWDKNDSFCCFSAI